MFDRFVKHSVPVNRLRTWRDSGEGPEENTREICWGQKKEKDSPHHTARLGINRQKGKKREKESTMR